MLKSEPSASLALVSSDCSDKNAIEKKLCGTLIALHKRLNSGNEKALKAGVLVQWKPGLRNRKTPDYGNPAIIVDVLEAPLVNMESKMYTPYFREPLDIIIGVLDDDGDFLLWYVDSRRFEPYTGPGSNFRGIWE